MRTVMYTWDLTRLLRLVDHRFRFTWNNRNHYREMGVCFERHHLCAAEQGVMADTMKIEEDPLYVKQGFHGKPYYRRSWPSCLQILCAQLVKVLGLKGVELAARVRKYAKRMQFDFTDRRFAG